MIVTDKKFWMNNFLVGQCQLIAKRIHGKSKLDALMLIDGDEGYGKTTLAVQIAYLVAYLTNRPFGFNCENVFFDIDKMIQFASNTKDQIIVWDEAALGGLSSESYNKNQIKLLKLLMVARKKRHFFIFNIPRFYRLKEAIVDRALALIHVYAKNEVELGQFVYYKKVIKEALYNSWRTSKRKMYRKFAKLRGNFGDHLAKIINEQEYDRLKDIAIMSIANEPTKSKSEKKVTELKLKISKIHEALGISQKKVAEALGVSPAALNKWSKGIDVGVEDVVENSTTKNFGEEENEKNF